MQNHQSDSGNDFVAHDLPPVLGTPSAAELLANPDWVALFGDISRSALERTAQNQAQRAADYFAAIARASA